MESNLIYHDDPVRLGNDFFAQMEYEKAVEAFSMSIQKYPYVSRLYWNRAITYLKLGRPFHAWKDIDNGLALNPDSKKLIYRKCKSLLELRRFHEAAQFLYESIGRLNHLTKNKDFTTLINDIHRLRMEYEYGQYDLLTMIEESKTSKYLANHADYYAWNKFEIREIEGKGRGLFAKERIEAGELLIACKAFVAVDISTEGALTFDPMSCNLDVSYFAPMVEKARKKLIERPDLADQFYRLYAGPRWGPLDQWTESEWNLIDMDRIQSIIRFNHFGIDGLFDGSSPSRTLNGANGCGLWLIPSYINHSCVDTNCSRYFVGDYMFVRASKSIEKDEEILLYYVSPAWPFEKRQRVCRDTFGFECQCRLCTMDRQDSIEIKQRMEEIRNLTDDTLELTGSIPWDIPSLNNLLRDCLQLRPQRDLNYLAVTVQEALAASMVGVNTDESLWLRMECLEIYKWNRDFTLALGALQIMQRHAWQFRGPGEQEEWMKEAREIAKLMYGDERMAGLMFTQG